MRDTIKVTIEINTKSEITNVKLIPSDILQEVCNSLLKELSRRVSYNANKDTMLPRIPTEKKLLKDVEEFLKSKNYTLSMKPQDQISVQLKSKKFKESKNQTSRAYFKISVECTGLEDAR